MRRSPSSVPRESRGGAKRGRCASAQEELENDGVSAPVFRWTLDYFYSAELSPALQCVASLSLARGGGALARPGAASLEELPLDERMQLLQDVAKTLDAASLFLLGELRRACVLALGTYT